MLRVHESKSAEAAVKYLDKGLARDDYYNDRREVKGQWLGIDAERLGLVGDVERKDFVALVRNRDPLTGKRLTPRDKSNRRPGYDAVLSAWKSASVMEALYGLDEIRFAFVQAGDAMMELNAQPEMRTRVRVDGQDCDRVTGSMICAGYLHMRARPVDGKSDMHMHKHYYLINATYDSAEGRFKAAQLGDLKASAPDLELEFDARFGKKLLALGYVPVMGKTGVQIKGVPQSVIDKFSRSSKRIEKESAARGVTDGAGKHRVADLLRESKDGDLPLNLLMADWQGRLTTEEREALERVRDKKIEAGPEITARQAMEFAIGHLFQRGDVVTERKLRKTAVHYGIGYVSPEEINREIGSALSRGEILAKSGEKGRRFAKTSSYRDQFRMTQAARDGRGQCEPLTSRYQDLDGLSAEQNAVAKTITEGRDRYMGFRGPAGTGKSYTLKGVQTVIESRAAAGQEKYSRALALAPSTSASRGELRKAGFRDANTLAAFFASEKMQKDMQAQMLIVDEAGMMSTSDMLRLMTIAEKNDNRVLFVGDYRQHPSVDAGDAFRLLQSEGGLKYAELTLNRRQKNARHREAVDGMATGTEKGIREGFDMLDKMGAVVVEPDRQSLRRKLTNAYLQSADEGKSGLIITPTHAEADYLTAELRHALRERGAITGGEVSLPKLVATRWTNAQKKDTRIYEPGMMVSFHRATPGVRQSSNGRRATVGGFGQGESAIVLESGREVILGRADGTRQSLPPEYAERFEVYRVSQQQIARGDRIRITRNGKVKVEGQTIGTSVNNGDIYPVEGFTKQGDVRLAGGKLLPRNYGHFTFGYAVTSHRSQGNTVDNEFVDWSSDALAPVNKQGAYVSMSRFRENITIFVNNKEEVKKAIGRGGERLSALELMKEEMGEEKVTVKKRFDLRDHLERNRVAAYLRRGAAVAAQAVRNLAQLWPRRGGLQHV